MKLANIFTIIACRIINAPCRCMDRGCESKNITETKIIIIIISAVFLVKTTLKKDDGREVREAKQRRKKSMTQTIFHNFQHDVHSLLILYLVYVDAVRHLLAGIWRPGCFIALTVVWVYENHSRFEIYSQEIFINSIRLGFSLKNILCRSTFAVVMKFKLYL